MWFNEWFIPMVDYMQIQVISWEEVITIIQSSSLEAGLEFERFYRGCLRYCNFL